MDTFNTSAITQPQIPDSPPPAPPSFPPSGSFWKKNLLILSLSTVLIVITLIILLFSAPSTVPAPAIRPSATPIILEVSPTLTTTISYQNDKNSIITELLDYIETQKSGSFYKMTNTKSDLNYIGNSYLSRAYFSLYRKTGNSKYLNTSIELADALISHCNEKAEFRKDCYYILLPFFDIYSLQSKPKYLEFIRKNITRLEQEKPESMKAYAHMSDDYFRYYTLSGESKYLDLSQSAYNEAAGLLAKYPNDIGILFLAQKNFHVLTGNQEWLRSGINYFSKFNKLSYTKMYAGQKIDMLDYLRYLARVSTDSSQIKYNKLHTELEDDFMKLHLNPKQGFVCLKSGDCTDKGESAIVDNAEFITYLTQNY